MHCGEHMQLPKKSALGCLHPKARLKKEAGFTFVWLLLALVVLGLGSQQVFVSVAREELSAKTRQQARLLKIYNDALQAYYLASPGTEKRFPMELQELLLDQRMIQTTRHLRKLYADPLQPGLAPTQAWGLIRNGKGQISGIYAIEQGQKFGPPISSQLTDSPKVPPKGVLP